MRRPLVAGNWKLNGSRLSSARLIQGLRAGLQPGWRVDVMVCPPFVYLAEIGTALSGTGVFLGAQSAAAESTGAFTGEVSAAMLRDVGCSHVIVGHSERRALYGETDEVVAPQVHGGKSGRASSRSCASGRPCRSANRA